MDTRSETFNATNGARVEVGTITHQGKDFSSLGSIIDEANGVIVGYPKGDTLTTWDGKEIEGLRLTITSSWPTPRSFMSSRMYSYRARFNGRMYHGRGFGDGMLLRLHASKKARAM